MPRNWEPSPKLNTMHRIGQFKQISLGMNDAASRAHPLRSTGSYSSDVSQAIGVLVCTIDQIGHHLNAGMGMGWEFSTWGGDGTKMVEKDEWTDRLSQGRRKRPQDFDIADMKDLRLPGV